MELKIPLEYVVAARLADPFARGQVDFRQAVEWPVVFKILIKNRIPLISLTGDPQFHDCPLMSNADFLSAVEAEALKWKSLRDRYGEVRQGFLQKGVQSILLKSTGLDPSFPYTSDNLDTLVRSEQVEQSRQVLNALGYVELRNIEEPKKWLFRKFISGESVSDIHLHGVVGWGVPFLDDSTLWKRARVSEDDPWVMVPAPEDAALITIAHAFYENKSLKLLDIARIRHCLRQGNLDFLDMERICRERGWEKGFAFCLLLYNQIEAALYGETLIPSSVLDWARSIVSTNPWLSGRLEKTLARDQVRFPYHVSFFFGKVEYYRKILNDHQRKPATRLSDVVNTLAWGIKHKLNIRGQRGIIISISGIDGAGKTVHVQSLVKAFETSEIKPRVYWSRFGSSAQKNAHAPTGEDDRQPSDVATALARRRQKLRNPLARSGWLAFHMISYITRCTLNVRFSRWFGGVVVCDRYIYDAMVEIQASLPNDSLWPRRAERLLALLCPRPDIAWLLDVPPEISVERQAVEKGGMAACEELAKQQKKFISLASTYHLNVIPAASRFEETSSQVIRQTLVKYYENYGTLVNALLLSNPNQRNPQKGIS